MEELDERISLKQVENKFSVLFLALRTNGVQTYLDINIQADPAEASKPIPTDKLDHLVKFAEWLFGSETKKPLVSDSRYIDEFGKILESPQAIEYLENTESPVFETAYRLAGGDELETISTVERAIYSIEQALGTAHLYVKNARLQNAVRRLGKDALQLVKLFPDIESELLSGED